MSLPKKTPVTILIVEDDDVDMIAIRRGLTQRKIANDIVAARDGLEALQILRGAAGQPPLCSC